MKISSQPSPNWFGELPKGWSVVRNKVVFREIDDRSQDGSEELLTVSHLTGVTPRAQKENVNMFLAESKAGYKRVAVGDLAINTMWAWMGALGFSQYAGIVSPAYNVYRFRTKNADIGYFARLFSVPNFTKEIVRYSTGIWESRLRLYPEGFFKIRSPLPPITEQRTISRYLDGALEKIDKLTALRQRQMELLQEQRTAVIQQAVTRGLNKRAPLKDSGLPWLGQIPKHWEVKRLKFLCHVTTGGKDTIDAEPEGEFPFFVRSQTVERINSFSFDGEAVLTAGDGAGVGKVFHYYNGKLDFHQRVYLLHGFRHVAGKFFFQYLRSLFHVVALGGEAKSTVDSLRMHIFLNFEVCVPPATEQKEILKWIEGEETKFEALHRAYERQLELLIEYRAALIYECVTGQRAIPQEIQIEKPERQANVHFRRSVLAAEIIHLLHDEPTLGRVKLEKIIFLSEAFAGIDLEGHYQRAAAGPFDNRALRSIETQIQKQKWYQPVKHDKGTRYMPMEKAGAHGPYFEKYWAEQRPKFDRIIELLRPLKTENCEMIATVFAVWRDRLAAKQPVTDDLIVDEVLTNWHPNKQKIPRDRWLKALDWIRQRSLTPTANAPRVTEI
jgi:type I restriction enzyme S subunit